MTIVSTSGKASPSYPPVDDAINFLKGINWNSVGSRVRVGVSNLLLFAMKFSEKSYDFHQYLYEQVGTTDVGIDPKQAEFWTIGALYGRFFLLCSFLVLHMQNTFDFQIIAHTDVPGISLVIAQNEDAFSYLCLLYTSPSPRD